MLNQNGKTNKGYVTQIIGPVLDIKFLKEIYHLFIVQSELVKTGFYC
jgi:F0F1-type ATP synthase beta subunit